VYSEFLNYYIETNIQKPIKEVESAILRLKEQPPFFYLESIIKEETIEEAKNYLSEQLLAESPLISMKEVPVAQIVSFLIKNKQETKKDNTRDLLIWLTLIDLSKSDNDYQVILITNDKIFEENTHFQDLLVENSIRNLRTYSSIAGFLSEYGVKVNFLTKDLFLAKLPKDTIEREIRNDVSSLPSNMSYFYYHDDREFVVEHFEVLGYKIEEYYTFKDIDTQKIKFILHVKVPVKIIFEPEKNIGRLKQYLSIIEENNFYAETFDNEGRPIYDEEILFIFDGEIDLENQDIKSIEFVDFFPDNYKYEKMRQHLTGRYMQLPSVPRETSD
jgi:hypothetical protein